MLSLSSKISCGIDISESRISVVILKQRNGTTKIVKAFDGPVPDGAVVDGNIAEPVILGQAIRKLIRKNKARVNKATVSLVAKPFLAQIVNIPEEMPGNLGKFIQSEIRHSAFLAGKECNYDYCSLGEKSLQAMDRVLVGATDNEKTMALVKTFNVADIEIQAVEPGIISAARAIYSKKIASDYENNTLLAFMHGCILSICVFRDTNFDFIRCVDLGGIVDASDEDIARCTEEINAVIQYYDIEVDDTHNGNWNILVVFENHEAESSDVEFYLQKKLGRAVSACSESSIYEDTVIEGNEGDATAPISTVGLALRQFEGNGLSIDIDMTPQVAEEFKANKRLVLLTANTAAMVILLMLLFAGFVNHRLGLVKTAMGEKNSAEESIEELLNRQREINEQITSLSSQRSGIQVVNGTDNAGLWCEALREISRKIPKTLDIKTLNSYDGMNLEIQGNALAFKSIHLFVELLAESKLIESASVAETNKRDSGQGMVSYVIRCKLYEKGATSDVDG
jgi:Tfp pilus assembly protein PilN